MNLFQYLTAVLTEDAGIAALVKTRVYRDFLPQKPELPAVVFAQVSEDPDETLEGATDLVSRRVEVTSWAADSAAAGVVARAVKAFLEAHQGARAGFQFCSAHYDGGAPEFDEVTRYWLVSQVWEVVVGGEES